MNGTGLLISVRDGEEAETALAGGADLLDVKEPVRGSLGAATPAVWREVLQRCRGRVPTSAALGELDEAQRSVGDEALAGFDFAKTGLAGCRADRRWPDRWAELVHRLPDRVAPVAVVYADWRECGAPAPEEIIDQAKRLACGAVLLDTRGKQQGDLLDHLSVAQLAPLVARIRQHALRVVLAGSLGPASIVAALELRPDYIAVRRAACRAGRTSRIELDRVRALSRMIHGSGRRRPSDLGGGNRMPDQSRGV
jgi:(5-formylfuran-3-yl)methyl phosphate synthase